MSVIREGRALTGSIDRFGPGQRAAPTDLQPGDLILTHGFAVTSRIIRFGQRIRFRGVRRTYAFWNHVAVVEEVGSHATIIEALAHGVVRSPLSKYDPRWYAVARVTDSSADRRQMLWFLRACVGQQYGYLTIVSVALWAIFGGRLTIALDGTEICSGLAARATERAGMIYARSPQTMMPADLAETFDVQAPT